jgi:hypothetical protein
MAKWFVMLEAMNPLCSYGARVKLEARVLRLSTNA